MNYKTIIIWSWVLEGLILLGLFAIIIKEVVGHIIR